MTTRPPPPSPFDHEPGANTRRQQPPPLVIPPTPPLHANDSPEHSQTGTSSPGPPTGASSAPGRATRRVQWPAELSNHASHIMASPTSPQTLQDSGARDALTRALEAHQSNPDRPVPSRYVGTSAPPSESASRAESSDGDNEERINDMKDQSEVFIDPDETLGLPSVGTKSGEAKTSKAAWNLVRGYTSGSYGMMRHRKNGGFKGGLGESADVDLEKRDEETRAGTAPVAVDDDDEKREGGVGGFLRNLIKSDNATDIPDSAQGFPGAASMGGGGVGVLSALMALQAQQQNPASGGNSGATSAATSPSTSGAPSIRHDDGDSSDEESERLKFTQKQRAKRNGKNAFHSTSSAVADVTKYVGSTASKTAGAVLHLGQHPHKRNVSVVAGPESPPAATPMDRSAGSTNVGSGTSSRPNTAGEAPSPGLQPRKKKGVFGETLHQVKRLGETFGIEHETASTRPEAARSSAGVFGGLMLSTVRELFTL